MHLLWQMHHDDLSAGMLCALHRTSGFQQCPKSK